MKEIDSFIDKKGRTIKIVTDEIQFCYAYFDKKEIGRFEYEIYDDVFTQYIYICHMRIDENYRYAGIGKRLLRVLSEFNDMHIAMPNRYENNRDAPYYLIDDGPCFKESCIREGLVLGLAEEE